MFQDVKIEGTVKEQSEYEMPHWSHVTVTMIHKVEGWNSAGGSWVPSPLWGYKGVGALTLPSQMKAEEILGTQFDALSIYLWSYQWGEPFPWKTAGWDGLTCLMGVSIWGLTSYLGFVSTASAMQKWCEHICLGSGMGNVKGRDITLPSYKSLKRWRTPVNKVESMTRLPKVEGTANSQQE